MCIPFFKTSGPSFASGLGVLTWLLLAAVAGGAPPVHEILAKVAQTAAKRHATAYSGMRRYKAHNLRFDKTAEVVVRMTYRPGQGKQFTFLERSGSDRLIGVIERLIETEAEASRQSSYGIEARNYDARVRGSETVAGRECYVLDLTPKRKSKYLVGGAAWVDKDTGGIVRLDGTTAASVSIWLGNPRVVEEFGIVSGIWLPLHTKSSSNTLLLGQSDLEIRYTDYEVERP
jgi:MucB/RseB N-terminal domain